mmetsp:Transcript_9964/g.16001  ORF Transcript_9964/g.16001 Transcript_9964/m.16001 type:complete len:230 (+) Transcript_9964:535-1224(+)
MNIIAYSFTSYLYLILLFNLLYYVQANVFSYFYPCTEHILAFMTMTTQHITERQTHHRTKSSLLLLHLRSSSGAAFIFERGVIDNTKKDSHHADNMWNSKISMERILWIFEARTRRIIFAALQLHLTFTQLQRGSTYDERGQVNPNPFALLQCSNQHRFHLTRQRDHIPLHQQRENDPNTQHPDIATKSEIARQVHKRRVCLHNQRSRQYKQQRQQHLQTCDLHGFVAR